MVFKIFKLQQWSQGLKILNFKITTMVWGWGGGAGGGGGSTKLYTHLRFVKNGLPQSYCGVSYPQSIEHPPCSIEIEVDWNWTVSYLVLKRNDHQITLSLTLVLHNSMHCFTEKQLKLLILLIMGSHWESETSRVMAVSDQSVAIKISRYVLFIILIIN